MAKRVARLVAVLTCGLLLASCALPQDRAAQEPARGQPGPVSPVSTSTPSSASTPDASAAGTPSGTPSQPTTAQGRTFDPNTSVTVTVSGDLLWHMGLIRAAAADAKTRKTGQPYEFGPMLAPVKPIIEGADLSICHTEVPVAPPGAKPSGYPAFGSPADTVRATKDAGFDLCTTSSNHSYDRGWAGLVRTRDLMDQYGLLATGTFRTTAERETPTIFTTRNGVKVALVSGTYGLNGIKVPADKKFAVAMLDADDMIARAKAARDAGADIVLAAMHAGTEYQVLPTAQQKTLATKLTASPYIDAVYGHHAHVVQPITKINGKWVIYGVSNLIGQMRYNTPSAWEGIIAKLTFTPKEGGGFTVGQVEYVPLLVTDVKKGPARVLPVNASLKSGVGNKARLQVALNRTRKAVHALKVPGLVEG